MDSVPTSAPKLHPVVPGRPLTRAERQELHVLRTCPLPMTGAQLQRYIVLSAQAEREFHREMTCRTQRRQAWRTCGEVVFWLAAIPVWVGCALLGVGVTGTLLIGWVAWALYWPLPLGNEKDGD